ncbi:MAG: CBS domain-containing protein [Tepidisphaeraceae bacterium]
MIRHSSFTVWPDATLRDAANEMILHDVGRLVVADPANPRRAIGIITRSDLLRAQRRVLDDMIPAAPAVTWRRRKPPASERMTESAGAAFPCAPGRIGADGKCRP